MDFKFDPNENEGKIPYLATIYEPREDEKINELLNKPTRRIYYIPLEDYREEEKEKLIEYYEFCLTKNYKIKTDIKGCKYYYPNIFRQLQGSDFDIEKSFDEIRKEINFKIEKLPIVYNDIYKEIFNTGCIYIHGRDNAYRPLIIFNPGMLNSLNQPIEIWKSFGIFLMEFLVNKCLVPSRVENWNIIVDLGSLSMADIPYSLKEIFTAFKGIYRCRLYKLYLLNMNFVFNLVWSIVKMIMGPTLEAKACNVDTNDGSYDDLFKFINRSQLEKKYGGTAEDLKKGEYYPFRFISDHYFCENSNDKIENIDNSIDNYVDNDSKMVFYEARSE
jgi:hypothetical protein